MSERWLHFRRNARPSDVVKTVLFVPLFMVLAIFIFENVSLVKAWGALAIAFLAPYLFRNYFARHLVAFLRVVNIAPAAAVLILFAVKLWLPKSPELLYAIATIFGFYVGAFFWVLSSPDVQVSHTR